MLNYMTLSDGYPILGSFHAVGHNILCAVALVFYFSIVFLAWANRSHFPSHLQLMVMSTNMNYIYSLNIKK